MKTHDVAQILVQLARILRSGPNVDLADFQLANSNGRKSDEVIIGLSTLVDLSRVDKSQWLSVIHEHQFPIEVRPRDASRDILGKLLTYLEKHPEARQKLKENVSKRTSHASPELMKALNILLKD